MRVLDELKALVRIVSSMRYFRPSLKPPTHPSSSFHPIQSTSTNTSPGLKGTFCPCFVFGKTQARIRDPSLATYERINNDCLLWVGANCCHVAWVLTLMKRMEIRETYHIKGDTVTDCLFSAFCHCCALIQQEKEVIAKQTQQGLVSNVGYQAPAGMSANPNSTGVVQ